jgi:recombination protein RecT
MKEQFAMALPKHFSADRLLRLTMTAVQKDPKLLDCHQQSFLGALLECAQLGLEPNTTLGHAWLIPFWNNRQRRLDAQLVPGYKGLIKLAYQSGQVASIGAFVVRAKDDFKYRYGLRPRLTHRPHREADAGDMVAVYAVAEVRGIDRPLFKVLERWECEQIRDRFSKAAYDKQGNLTGTWLTNFEEMSMKSAIRRLVKFVPSDTEKNFLARAVDHDERAEAGIGQEFGDVIDLGPEDVSTPEPGAKADDEGKPQPQPQPQPQPEQAVQASNGNGGAATSKLDQLAAETKAKREGKQA